MNKTATVASVVIIVAIAFSAYAYMVYLPGTGSSNTSAVGAPSTLNIYLTDKPSNVTLKSLVVNVTSLTLKYVGVESTQTSTSSVSSSSSASTTTTSSFSTSSTESESSNRFTYNISAKVGTNVNLTKLQGTQLLLGSPKIPPGNVTGLILHIMGARASYSDGTSEQLKVVADGKLMIPVHFVVQPNGTTNLTLDITPNMAHTSQGVAHVLTPVIHVTAVSSGDQGTSTFSTEASESESETETSTSSSTS